MLSVVFHEATGPLASFFEKLYATQSSLHSQSINCSFSSKNGSYEKREARVQLETETTAELLWYAEVIYL